MPRALLGAAALATVAGLSTTTPGLAHPHVFVDVKSDLVFAEDGKLVSVRHAWRFDEGYSAFASQGLDTDGDGSLTVEELAPLAEVNVQSMAEYDYFTFVTAGNRELILAAPNEYWLQSDGGFLTLYFTVPISEPVEVRSLPASIEVFDPTFYVSFVFVDEDPIRLDGAPQGCKFEVTRPSGLDETSSQLLAGVGPEQRELPPELQALTVGQTNGVQLGCP
ncbi:MAG TPA: DUF1007 family protein [Methylomirabilota bacterium]|nr:DUF1007 family protein [Methylomirabilota bacterium]